MSSRLSVKERSWAFYDWANSAYSVVVVTAIFPLYFKEAASAAGISASVSTAYWGYANSISTLFISLLAPILGTLADFKNFKKRFFFFFASLGIVFTFLLAAVPADQWLLLLICFILTSVGYAGANIFYDAFLVDVTDETRMHRVSSYGFAYGYVGSIIPFLFGIVLILLSQNQVISLTPVMASQAAFAITALWWGLFTIPLIKNVEQVYYAERVPKLITASFKKLFATIRNIRSYKTLSLFLLAYFFYIDGVNTITVMATAFGSDLGIGSADLLMILLVTQIVAAPSAILFGNLAERYQEKRMIMAGIGIYIGISVYAYFLDSLLDFWIIALLVGCAQGGVQALSRSYFAKLIPKEASNEFFGFYNIFGKFAAIIGPLLVGVTAQMTGRTNDGVFSLILLFIIGVLILMKLPRQERPFS
ncbi:MFS transporter [Bacillus massiliglaciei]|uniref:MFS transporter n=1 Tax=Bacillus massiliglaciei TaxID=1816693 RepID=UPI000A5B5042|nr:MFS transporter [Bacillus massiliglaciei]